MSKPREVAEAEFSWQIVNRWKLPSHGCVEDQILLRSGQDARNEQTITLATMSASLK